MDALNEVCDVLDTYKGRDKLIRTLCYTSKLVGSLTQDRDLARKLLKFGSIMSKTRTVLRLFDDLPMLRHNLEYRLGDSEPDMFMRLTGITGNLIDTIFYPIEKVAWLAENDLIKKDATRWDIASCICWVSSVYLGLLRSIRQLWYLNANKKHIHDYKTSAAFKKQQTMETLTLIRLIFDLIHSVNGLPPGYLWSSKLLPWQVSLVGTASSVIGFYQIFARRAK